MPPVPVNYLAILVAAIASMFIGFLWYGPVFGKPWMAMMGITKEQVEKAKKSSMTKQYVIMFIGSLIMAWVLAHALIFAATYLQVTGVAAGLEAGFFNWLGFIAPVMLGSVLWEGKSWKLWFLNVMYYLVTLCVMGVILALWV